MHDRFDLDALKRAHPVADVIARYDVELRPTGRALVGRCPFHDDQGRPNLHVYPESDSWYCYRCCVGGDVLSFVMRHDGLPFKTACERVAGGRGLCAADRPTPRRAARPPRRPAPAAPGPAERACLAAAVELYQGLLAETPMARRYVEDRGVDRSTIERCRLGFAADGELLPFLRWRRLPVQAAVRAGLLTRACRETMAGRVVVPEIRNGQPVWLIGRTIAAVHDGPKYLGLAGRKQLLGWDAAVRARTVWLVEGVFDWLTLRTWGLPALCLLGTRVRPHDVAALVRFDHIHVALDDDEAGRDGAAALCATLGPRAVAVPMPGVEDVAELAGRRDGRGIFLRATREAGRSLAA